MLGPPDWVTVFGAGSVCEHVAPVQPDPLNVTVPAQVRATGPTGVSDASCVDVRLLGVYPKLPEHEAGMPGAPSWQPNPSAAPEPLQPVQLTSFWPAALTHLPLVQSVSLVQEQPWPCVAHVPPAALQPPRAHDHVPGMDGAASQVSPSQPSLASGVQEPSLHVGVATSGGAATSLTTPASCAEAGPSLYESRPTSEAHAAIPKLKPIATMPGTPRRNISDPV
jgi:hypothetical protein